MVLIREAAEEDNGRLIELQKRCPMGTSLVLGVDSAPDFFARSRAFEDWRVFVATEDDTVIGSAGAAARDTVVDGQRVKTAYEYGFMVDPQHRRKGVAKMLQRHIEQVALGNGVDMLHLDIIEDNTPSVRLFSQLGFERVKECTTFSLMPYKTQRIARETSVRSMQDTDVDTVTALVNDTFRDYDFFTPYRPDQLRTLLTRMPHFNFHNVLLLENDDRIEACLGYWEYDKVRKYSVQKLNWRLKAQTYLIRVAGLLTKMPHIPRLGQTLLSYNITVMAYRNLDSLTDLVQHLINTALPNKIDFIHVTVDPASPMAAILRRFTHTKMKLYVYTKSLRRKGLPQLGERKLYIDAREM